MNQRNKIPGTRRIIAIGDSIGFTIDKDLVLDHGIAKGDETNVEYVETDDEIELIYRIPKHE